MDGGATVVIAEDESGLQDLLKEVLESADYDVEAYSDGEACWERLRDDDRLAEVPVVFLSGRDRRDEAIDERGVTADDYVTKPFSPSDLRERIDRLV